MIFRWVVLSNKIINCLKVFRGRASTEEVLKCTHEEADGRIFFHVNDGIKRDNFTNIVVASPDRYLCKCSLSFYSMVIL